MIITRIRLAALFALTAALAACDAANSTKPNPLAPVASRRSGDSVPNPMCKSGYSNTNGHCLGE